MRLTAIEVGKTYAFKKYGHDRARPATVTAIGDKLVTVTCDEAYWANVCAVDHEEIVTAEVRPDALVCPWGEYGQGTYRRSTVIAERRKNAKNAEAIAHVNRVFRLNIDDVGYKDRVTVPLADLHRAAKRLGVSR